MPLNPQVVVTPFDKWGMDLIGPIDPPSNGKSYILVCIDYLTIWVEVRAMKHAYDHKVAEFLYEEIFTRYFVLRELVTDQGEQFTSNLITKLMQEYNIGYWKSSPYHPQANGQEKATNREIEAILTKIVQLHYRDWSNRLPEVVWAYRTTWKTTKGFTLFELLYGKIAMLPIEFEHKTLRTTLELNIDLPVTQRENLLHLNSLDEMHKSTLEHIEIIQKKRKQWHDSHIKNKKFQVGDWAFLYDSRFKELPGKLHTRWLGPYEINHVFANGPVQLTTIHLVHFKILVNGHWLKLYQKPQTKEDFLQ